MTSFNYAIHDGAKTFHIGFLFMHSTVAPHLSAPERESRTDPDPSLKKRLETTVRGLSTEVAVVLGGARIDLSEFLRLERGDVLVLDRRVGEALEISMGGRALFL
ncbi:MAG TPA: FliM/FliN family flagellar motor switch protein, partial [Plasticicumulans sp.]|nr:FliM/FliN family flagellar motor switch protein [Plasticicumulans sp.]